MQETIDVILEGKAYKLKSEYVGQTIRKEKKVQLPQGISSLTLERIIRWLEHKDTTEWKGKNYNTMIEALRIGDLLQLQAMKQIFITEVIVPSFDEVNCLPYLNESYQRLRNVQNGSQQWYNLLSSSITYFTAHIYNIYPKQTEKIKKLSEKVIHEVVDRALRNLKEDDKKQKAMLFDILMQSKKSKSADALCNNLRQLVQMKKINVKLHAKLSWKLVDVPNLKQKHTKNFTFLQMQWSLQGVRQDDGFHVRLHLCPHPNTKPEIGVFYAKLFWTDGTNKREQRIQIHFLRVHYPQEMPIFIFNTALEKQLCEKKVQLSIFCSVDQIYSFTLNHICANLSSIPLDEKKLKKDELVILAEYLKESQRYKEALQMTAAIGEDLPQNLTVGYPPTSLTAQDNKMLLQLKHKQRLLNQPKRVQTIELKIDLTDSLGKAALKKEFSVQKLKIKVREGEERAESKGRLRKIFPQSNDPQGQLGQQSEDPRRREIIEATRLSNFLRRR